MSILNIWVEPHRVLMCADTITDLPEGGFAAVSKMMPLVHLNCILAGRGHLSFFALLFTLCRAKFEDFDVLSAAMPSVANSAIALLKNAGGADALTDPQASLEEQYIVLAGWSEEAHRMVAHEFRCEAENGGFIRTPIPQWYISPWSECIARQNPAPKDINAMEKLAREQLELYKERFPNAAAGGRLIAAEIYHDGMHLYPACELPCLVNL